MTASLSRRGLIMTGSGLAVLPAVGGCGAPATDGKGGSAVDVPKGTALVATADVPIGGCAVNAERKVVVTQPTEGVFRAFSAVCTHQGCLVSSSRDGDIPCQCHGSRFALTDGHVLKGPAAESLDSLEVTVVDDTVTSG